jgi:ketosteroid isomerase-like protein
MRGSGLAGGGFSEALFLADGVSSRNYSDLSPYLKAHQPGGFMSNANVNLIQNLYAAFGRGDIATIISAMTPDVEWETVGRPADFPTLGRRRGQVGVQRFFELVAQHFDFSEFSPKEFFATDNVVFVLGHYAMTVKKTEGKAESDWIHIFTIADGKVAKFREFLDTAPFIAAYRG